MESAFSVPEWITGIVLCIIVTIVSLGGIKYAATIAEKLAPFMALLYVCGSLIIIFVHIENVGAVFTAILKGAFGALLYWSHYGVTAWHYLFGQKTQIIYKLIFSMVVYLGSTMSLSLAWNLSDTFNGLMMIPNIIGVLALSPLVGKITKNYLDRELVRE